MLNDPPKIVHHSTEGLQSGVIMDFFDFACQEADRAYKSLGWAGIKEAFRISEGYMFRADYGEKYDGTRMYCNPILFAIEKDNKVYQIAYGSPEFVAYRSSAQPIVVPDKYLSPRLVNTHPKPVHRSTSN